MDISNYIRPCSSLLGSLQVILFANIYLTVAVTGKTPKSNQLEIRWLSPTVGES